MVITVESRCKVCIMYLMTFLRNAERFLNSFYMSICLLTIPFAICRFGIIFRLLVWFVFNRLWASGPFYSGFSFCKTFFSETENTENIVMFSNHGLIVHCIRVKVLNILYYFSDTRQTIQVIKSANQYFVWHFLL